MKSWKLHIKNRMKIAHGNNVPKDFERPYWEVSLMCHLLGPVVGHPEGYPYADMAIGNRSTVSEAMRYFAQVNGPVDTIPADELSLQTRKSVMDESNALAAEPGMELFTMKDLYITRLPNWSVLVTHLDNIQKLIGDDTASQKDPATGQPRFDGPCELCFPFYEWQKTGTGFPPAADVEEFFNVLGTYTLGTLLNTDWSDLTKEEKRVLKNAKQLGILTSPRQGAGPHTRIINFDNGLVCDTASNTCKPNSGFCLLSSNNTCSAIGG